jgi:hypothetical protein
MTSRDQLQKRLANYSEQIKKRNKLGILIDCKHPDSVYELSSLSKSSNGIKRLLLNENFSLSILSDDKRVFKNSRNPDKNTVLKRLGNSNEKFEKIFIHYSGHGCYNIDISSSRKKIFTSPVENLMLCSDLQFITDSEINEQLKKYKNKKAKICLLIDGCHSLENSSNLKYRLEFSNGYSVIHPNTRIVVNKYDSCKADIISISGYIKGPESKYKHVFKQINHNGILTQAFMHIYNSADMDSITVENFIRNMNSWLAIKNYAQIATVSFTQPYACRRLMKYYFGD